MRPGPQSRAVDRPAHPVPRVPRAEGGDPRPAREVGLGDRARRRDRRSAGDGEPADLQPERSRPDQGRRRIAIARSPTSSSRARRSSRSSWRRGSPRAASTITASSTPTRATSRSAPNYSRIRTTSGAIDLATILAKSSNVGMTKVALSLEPAQMYGTLTALGFGQVTTSGYPGESAGLLPHYSHWRPVGISSMSRGYGLSITPLQLAHAYATVGVVRHLAADLLPARRDAAGGRARARRRRRAHADPPARGRGRAGWRRQAGRDPRLHASPARPARRGKRPRAATPPIDISRCSAASRRRAIRGSRPSSSSTSRAPASTTAAKWPRRCSPASWAARCACSPCRPMRR